MFCVVRWWSVEIGTRVGNRGCWWVSDVQAAWAQLECLFCRASFPLGAVGDVARVVDREAGALRKHGLRREAHQLPSEGQAHEQRVHVEHRHDEGIVNLPKLPASCVSVIDLDASELVALEHAARDPLLRETELPIGSVELDRLDTRRQIMLPTPSDGIQTDERSEPLTRYQITTRSSQTALMFKEDAALAARGRARRSVSLQ